MPYEWTPPKGLDPPLAELHLWPYRSLLRRDFVTFLSLTAALVLIPLLAVIGSPVLWGLLPFVLIMFFGIWWALNRSYKDGEIVEELRLWPDRITLDRYDGKGGHRSWEANPYWVQVRLHETGGPVENYLTLRGNGREVEIGAFLSEEERKVLFVELQDKLHNLDRA